MKLLFNHCQLAVGVIMVSAAANAQFSTYSLFDESYHLQREYRSIDGMNNNRLFPQMGAAKTPMPRWFRPNYDDGISALSGAHLSSARQISNGVLWQNEDTPNQVGASDFLWLWGQWIDHDVTLVAMLEEEIANIEVPYGDQVFDKDQTGNAEIPFKRSKYLLTSGQSNLYPRAQINEITSWIDASNVYGSEESLTHQLRTMDGSGKMKTSPGNFLPFQDDEESSGRLFLAGDERVNEHTALMAMHTLFVREHNRFVTELAQRVPWLSGETLFQEGRTWVGALLQVITYNEFLPVLLGKPFPEYNGYSARQNGAIRNEFAAAAFRVGHTMVNDTFIRLDNQFNTFETGHLSLIDAFGNTEALMEEQGVEALFRGLALQNAQQVDTSIIDSLRNFLFPSDAPNRIGFDLASLNIQRGRDHGLPTFMAVWQTIGGWPMEDWSSFHTRSSEKLEQLASSYHDIQDMDLWVGLLAEQPIRGRLLGQALELLIGAQFWSLRQADRFWYERIYSGQRLQELKNTRLSDVIIRNTNVDYQELPKNVFLVPRPLRRFKSSFWKNR